MAEQVQTGGVMQFRYGRGNYPKASKEEREDIEQAYEIADERKRRERRRLWLLILLGIIIVVVIAGVVYYVYNN
jgi:hypothetical protein